MISWDFKSGFRDFILWDCKVVVCDFKVISWILE
jgi:hypothetical protein